MRTFDQAPIDANATADARAGDDTEHQTACGRRAIGRFGERETIGVVRHTNRSVERGLQITVERVPDQDGRVRILDETRVRADRPGYRHADAATTLQPLFGRAYQVCDRADHFAVAVDGRRHALS